MVTTAIPSAFVWRRLHSLMGLWLVLFLIEHLLVNSQAALLLGENGKGFVEMVNGIHNLPYLPFVEGFLLGVPIAIHAIWGIKYLLQSKSNSWSNSNSKTSLNYGRNHAFTWQRLTSWILLIGIILHVAKFRFIHYPQVLNQGGKTFYFVRIGMDQGLYTVADRLGVELYSSEQILNLKQEIDRRQGEGALVEVAKMLPDNNCFDPQEQMILTSAQSYQQKLEWTRTLERQKIEPHQVIAIANDFGTASLLSVRDTFKSFLYAFLYTIFVLCACFHGFNGLWTFCLTWGMILQFSMQRKLLFFTWGLMALIAFLGCIAIWGTYWLNLKV